MLNTDTLITDDNDIYIYFQMIDQLQPASILDAGLFLQRIGAVSRQAMSCEIPAHIYIEGIELFGQTPLPIYNRIYNRITILPEFDFFTDRIYDLAMCLHVNEWLHPDDRRFFWEYLITHARVILADTADADFVNFVLENCRCEALNLEGQQYALIYGNIPG